MNINTEQMFDLEGIMLKIRKARFIFVLLSIIIVLGFFITPFNTTASATTNQDNFIIITVKDGDTLWHIAQKYTTGKNIRRTIHEIEQINNIRNSMIYPGQQLKISAD